MAITLNLIFFTWLSFAFFSGATLGGMEEQN